MRPSRRLGKAGRRWLLLFHRWAGIAAGLFFALWIGSGLVMLAVPFPTLTEAERLALLAPIAWDRVAVAPDEARRGGGRGGGAGGGRRGVGGAAPRGPGRAMVSDGDGENGNGGGGGTLPANPTPQPMCAGRNIPRG